MPIKKNTLLEVFLRDNKHCILCVSGRWLEGIPHHAFYRSEYFKEDRNEAWNLVTIDKPCHFDIHHRGNKNKERRCKEIALNRYQGKYKDELLKIMREKRFLS